MVRRERQARFWREPEWGYDKPVRVGLFKVEQQRVLIHPDRYVLESKPYTGDRLHEMSVDEGEELMRRSDVLPQLVTEAKGRIWWMYESNIYSTTEDLEPDEVQALIEEKENKKRLRIARAKTVAAMTENLDRKGLRQPIPRQVKVAVWQRDKGRCVQCGSNEELEFDHIVPVARGGSNTERNVQLLCADCNREKGSSL